MENNYYKLSKELFENDKYKDLSANSKIAYAILNDIINDTSSNNRKIDDKNKSYLVGSREIIQEKLGISINTMTKIYKELSNANLIEEKVEEVGKSKIVYVNSIANDEKDKGKTDVIIKRDEEINKQEDFNPYRNILRAYEEGLNLRKLKE